MSENCEEQVGSVQANPAVWTRQSSSEFQELCQPVPVILRPRLSSYAEFARLKDDWKRQSQQVIV